MTLQNLPPLLRWAVCLFSIVAAGVALGFLVHQLASSSSPIATSALPSPITAGVSKVTPRTEPAYNPLPTVREEPSRPLDQDSSVATNQPPTPAVPALRPSARNDKSFELDGGILGQVTPSFAQMVHQNGAGGRLPAVLADPPEDLALTDEQTARFKKVAEDFFANIGDINQDPHDPAYKKRWQEAQWLADQEFQAYFGAELFMEMQQRAYLQTQQEVNSR